MATREPITRELAEKRIEETERGLAQVFWHLDPEDITAEVARRFRTSDGSGRRAQNPPHCMVHAIEAACAYFSSSSQLSVNPTLFDNLMHMMVNADSPAMELLIDEYGLTSFMAYLHRSQLSLQQRLWCVPAGRAEMLFADPAAIPKVSTAFSQRFGFTPRQWVQMACLTHAATAIDPSRMAFDEKYIEQLTETEIPPTAMRAFLEEVSLRPAEIGAAYRQIRYGDCNVKRCEPWTWYQRQTILAEHPVVRFPTHWAVPAPALLIPLFGELLFKRLAAVAVSGLREELSDRFVNYIERVFRHQLPSCRIVNEEPLKGNGEGKVADLAIELPNAILLIEAKSVVFDRNVLLSGSALEVIDGAIQVAETAKRIIANQCPVAGLPSNKPVVGVIATLGTFPHGNSDLLFESGAKKFKAHNLTESTLTSALLCRPFALGAEALESLAIYLRANPDGLPALVEEKRQANYHSVGDWPLFLNSKVQGGKGHDLSLWRSAFDRMLTEFGVREPAGKKQ